MAPPQSLLDPETLTYLDLQRDDDNKIVRTIEQEHLDIEFAFEHSERASNWKTDELYMERSFLAEAAFLEKIQTQERENARLRQEEEAASYASIDSDQRTFRFILNEMKSLKVKCDQNHIAAEKMKQGKKIMKERRVAAQQQLVRMKAQHERERKSLTEKHRRKLGKLALSRNLTLRDVEDPEIRVILKGLDFNKKTAAEESLKAQTLTQKEAKIYHAQVLEHLMRNQKEIEQLRELQLLQQRFAARYLDRELEVIDENEALLMEHTAQQQSLADQLKSQLELEESTIQSKLTALQHTQLARTADRVSIQIAEQQKKEAWLVSARHVQETERRCKSFWGREVEHLKAHLRGRGLATEGVEFEVKKKALLPHIPVDLMEEVPPIPEDMEGDLEISTVADEVINVEAAHAREMALFESLKKLHHGMTRKFHQDLVKSREALRVTQQLSLEAILAVQEKEIQTLKSQQLLDMKAFEEGQKASSKADEDNAASNERLYGLLPKFAADIVKAGGVVEPKEYECLTFATVDLVQFNAFSSKSTTKQVVTLLNRLYTQFDEAMDSFDDLFRLETIGAGVDSYSFVSGLNSQSTSPCADHAASVVGCALRFIEIVKKLDMSDQISDGLQLRIGIHSGSALGGVTNPAQPKYSMFGDAVTITGQIEQSSRPGRIHISGATYELIQGKFEVEVSESVSILDGTQKMASWWIKEAA
ncbi:hypothetical protein HDU98_002878 [Podochytrium sp. JEL0797]|nr:hypothetical protein HDU98_002878 [Podochytrium sp. JEL0797]